MKTKPFFSIIMAVHNEVQHLDRSINSVLQQSYINFELIIVDDAASEESEKQIAKFEDPRIRLIKRAVTNAGDYGARNLGIRHARYEWICFVDADDKWDINLLETVKHNIEKHQDVECVTWGWSSIVENHKRIDDTSLKNQDVSFRYFSLTNFFNQRHTLWAGALSIKRSLILAAGSFAEDEDYRRVGDVETWIRCLSRSQSNIWINKNLVTTFLDSDDRDAKMDASEVFSPLVMDLMCSADEKLLHSIKYYQNERIFRATRAEIIAGGTIDYTLIRKMNLSGWYFVLIARLLVNKLRYGIKTFGNIQRRTEMTESITANQFFHPLYDFDE